MIVAKDVYLDPEYTWISTKIKGPYSRDTTSKIFARPFTFRESNYFETLIKNKASSMEKFFFTISNCIQPKIDFDKALVGSLNTLYNLCLYYSGWTYDERFQFNGGRTVEERAAEWVNSLRGVEQILCVALLEGCTFKQLDNSDQLDYLKTLRAMQARYQAVFGDERYEWFMNTYYGEGPKGGVEVKQDFFADPGTKTQAGYEATQTTLRSKSMPTKDLKELQEEIRKGKIQLPKELSISPLGNAV